MPSNLVYFFRGNLLNKSQLEWFRWWWCLTYDKIVLLHLIYGEYIILGCVIHIRREVACKLTTRVNSFHCFKCFKKSDCSSFQFEMSYLFSCHDRHETHDHSETNETFISFENDILIISLETCMRNCSLSSLYLSFNVSLLIIQISLQKHVVFISIVLATIVYTTSFHKISKQIKLQKRTWRYF